MTNLLRQKVHCNALRGMGLPGAVVIVSRALALTAVSSSWILTNVIQEVTKLLGADLHLSGFAHQLGGHFRHLLSPVDISHGEAGWKLAMPVLVAHRTPKAVCADGARCAGLCCHVHVLSLTAGKVWGRGIKKMACFSFGDTCVKRQLSSQSGRI